MTEEAIKVYARVRPCFNTSDDSPACCQDEINDSTLRFEKMGLGQTDLNFQFEHTFWKDSLQEDIYEIVARPLLEHAIKGYNATLFAYGQTGSGKTFTITGDGTPANAGVVPRAINTIYRELPESKRPDFSVSVTYLQIYNNIGYDLLSKTDGTILKLEDLNKVTFTDSKTGTSPRGITECPANTYESAHRLFWLGENTREKAETVNNKSSSRSHTIFTFIIKRGSMKSRINFVDLAGSEKYKSLTQENADAGTPESRRLADRQLEARHINKSLLALQAVIQALNKKSQHVPFRDSSLTRFLKDSLVGNVKTAMVATISTKKSHIPESVSTCRFAESVSALSTTVRLNQREQSPQELISSLRAEVTRLRQELSRGGSGPSTGTLPSTMLLPGTIVTEADVGELKSKVMAYMNDQTDYLDVATSSQVQFCFSVMKELAKKGAAPKLKQLKDENAELKAKIATLVGLMQSRQVNSSGEPGYSKELAYFEFCNSHPLFETSKKLRASFQERCKACAALNETVAQQKHEHDDIQEQIYQKESELQETTDLLETSKSDDEAQSLELEIDQIQDEIEQLTSQLAKKADECDRMDDDLNSCKGEIALIDRELKSTRAKLDEDFERFWTNTVMKFSQPMSGASPRREKKRSLVHTQSSPKKAFQ